MLSPVSCASCSLMCLVGLGVAANAAFSVSNCFALIVVRGPLRLPPRFWSSFSLLPVSLSDKFALSASLTSSCSWSCESGDKLGSLQAVTECGKGRRRQGVEIKNSELDMGTREVLYTKQWNVK